MEPGSRPSIADLPATAQRWLWRQDLGAYPRWAVPFVRFARIVYAVVRDFIEGQMTLRAMSLVYTTLLSLVPLIAISFSVLKGFGAHNQVKPFLDNMLAPLGEKGLEISARIVEFVDNMQVGVLGFVGFALLFYTVISLMQKIERAFNEIWRIHRPRSLSQRFRDYLSVIIVGPALVFASLGISATFLASGTVRDIAAIEPVGFLVKLAGTLIPYLMIIAAFTFIYVFMPNTRVRLRSALLGGVVAGILWNTLGWAFASFVASSGQYVAVYSAFATLILFLIWLHIAWLVLLVGSSIAFYHQRPEYLIAERRELGASNRVRERLALLVMANVARHFYAGKAPWTADALALHLMAPVDAVDAALGALEKAGHLTRTGQEPPAYLPARPPETTEVAAILAAVRAADEDAILSPDKLPPDAAVDGLVGDLDRTVAARLKGRTVKDLAGLRPARGAEPPEPARPTVATLPPPSAGGTRQQS
jgi:membrane protein